MRAIKRDTDVVYGVATCIRVGVQAELSAIAEIQKPAAAC
jgi:hypothetical protein